MSIGGFAGFKIRIALVRFAPEKVCNASCVVSIYSSRFCRVAGPALREAMLDALAQLQELTDKVTAGGGKPDAEASAATVARHRKRNKLLPRERIQLLLDEGSPFLELSTLAGWGSDDPLGGGMVTGIGWVHGVECACTAGKCPPEV